MKKLFGCAVTYVKFKIPEKLQDEFPDDTGSRQDFDQQTQQAHEDFSSDQACREPPDGDLASVSPDLLKTAQYEYCAYLYYLQYASDNIQNDTSSVLDGSGSGGGGGSSPTSYEWVSRAYGDSSSSSDQSSTSAPQNSGDAISFLNGLQNKITDNAAESKTLLRAAMDSFNEYQRAYMSHALLQFDLAQIQDESTNTEKLHEPWAQATEKALNAQAPEKPIGF